MKKIIVEICKNIANGYTLLVSDKEWSTRISGAKVGGGRAIMSFEVNADELVEEIKKLSFEEEK